MTKRDFMMQFVLNRASSGNITTDGVHWAVNAEKAWNEIQERTRFKEGLHVAEHISPTNAPNV